MSYEYTYEANYSRAAPGKFAGILSESAEVVDETFRYLQSLFHGVEMLEAGMASDRELVRDLMWPASPWPREVMLSMLECRFMKAPSSVREEIVGCGLSGHSLTGHNLTGHSVTTAAQQKAELFTPLPSLPTLPLLITSPVPCDSSVCTRLCDEFLLFRVSPFPSLRFPALPFPGHRGVTSSFSHRFKSTV